MKKKFGYSHKCCLALDKQHFLDVAWQGEGHHCVENLVASEQLKMEVWEDVHRKWNFAFNISDPHSLRWFSDPKCRMNKIE